MKKKETGDWLEVRGQEFTADEARQASDFADTVSNYHVQPEELKDFLLENVKLGHRLFMAEMMPIDDMGILLLSEEDERLIKIAKDRCNGDSGGLYIPGSSSGIILKLGI
jgi:hypothetical protein